MTSGPVADEPVPLAKQMVDLYEIKLLAHLNCSTCPGQDVNPLRQCDEYRAAWQALIGAGINPGERLNELLRQAEERHG